MLFFLANQVYYAEEGRFFPPFPDPKASIPTPFRTAAGCFFPPLRRAIAAVLELYGAAHPDPARNGVVPPMTPSHAGGLQKKSPPLSGRAGCDRDSDSVYRLSWMTSASMVSTVVMTLLLAWKPRWVRIMSTISAAMSTFDVSNE